MAGIRMTGLASGMDTQSLIADLSKAYQTKVDNAKKKQTKAEWKKEAWASLNTKLFNFYDKALTTFKSSGTYNTKKVSGSLSGVKITAGNNAVSGNHSVKVLSAATAQMWTGKKINTSTYASTSYTGANVELNTELSSSDLYDSKGYQFDPSKLNGAQFTVQDGDGDPAEITINADSSTKVSDLLNSINVQLTSAGSKLKAEFSNGSLVFTNESATRGTTTAEDGTETTTYTDGYSIKVTATNDQAELLGLSSSGNTIQSMADSDGTYRASAFVYQKVETADASVNGSTKISDLMGVGFTDRTIKVNGQEITIDKTTTLSGLAKQMSEKGINASYDANQGRFYLSSKTTGTEFTIEADDDLKEALGLNLQAGDEGVIAAKKASIEYNGVTYEQESNTFNINGLTIEVTAADVDPDKAETQGFSVDIDTDAIYDKVKGFVKEYNDLITEMNKLYNADSSRGYEPLTSEEKDAMSDDEVKEWEKKIKDSLLRRDSTISTLLSSMRTTLNKSVEVMNADGTTSRYTLSSFGINTGSYTENGQLHIAGNADDASYADQEDLLRKAILSNPDAVIKTFTTLGNEMYSNLQKAMKSSEASSALTFYNDKQMDSEIKDYKDNVKAMQQKMQDEEDKYYKQFSAMESAMAKLQSQQTYISQLFGGA